MTDPHTHSWWMTPAGTLVCGCGDSRRPTYETKDQTMTEAPARKHSTGLELAEFNALYDAIARRWSEECSARGLHAPYPPRQGGRTDSLLRIAIDESRRWIPELSPDEAARVAAFGFDMPAEEPDDDGH